MGHGGQMFNRLQRYAQIIIRAFSKLINTHNKNMPLSLQNNYLAIFKLIILKMHIHTFIAACSKISGGKYLHIA